MLVAFAGTHVPLLGLIAFFVVHNSATLENTLEILAVALAATPLGTGITLFVLTHLLRPITLTAKGLRGYGLGRVLPQLPLDYNDEGGTLMADASHTLIKLDAAIEELKNHDRLTGYPNRATLLRRLAERSSQTNDAYTLSVLQLQNFDRVVSTFGDVASNAVLLEFSARLELALDGVQGSRAALSRIAGNIFAFVLETGASLPPAAVRALQIARDLGGEFDSVGVRFTPELALGLSVYPADSEEPNELLNNAIAALAHIAPDEKAPVRFFSKASNEKARIRFQLEHELRLALERDEFVLHYQPLIDLRQRTVVGAEALIRWNHPERGLLPPGAFIEVAEESGLIDPIGLWVLEAACRQLRAWSTTELAHLRISINLSARHFTDEAVVRQIGDALQRHAVPSSRLEIELTETAAVQDSQTTFRVLSALRAMGVSSAIDDFGTGYSSMSYLRTLPFDKLKIDRAFVQDVDQQPKSLAICRALVELSRGLGIAVLAEGVETAAEIAQLSALGCDLYQGFHFARPVAADKLAVVIVSEPLQRAIVGAAAHIAPPSPVERSMVSIPSAAQPLWQPSSCAA